MQWWGNLSPRKREQYRPTLWTRTYVIPRTHARTQKGSGESDAQERGRTFTLSFGFGKLVCVY